MKFALHFKAYDAYKAYRGVTTPEAKSIMDNAIKVWGVAKRTIKSLKDVRQRIKVVMASDARWVNEIFHSLPERELAAYLTYEKWLAITGRPAVRESENLYAKYEASEHFQWENWYGDLELRYLVFAKGYTPIIVTVENNQVDYLVKFPVKPICIVKNGYTTEVKTRAEIVRHWLDTRESWIPDVKENLNDYSDIPAKAAVLGCKFDVPGTHKSVDGNLELADKYFYSSSSREYANNEIRLGEEKYQRCLEIVSEFRRESSRIYHAWGKDYWEDWYDINKPEYEMQYIDWFKRNGKHDLSDEIINRGWHDNNEKHLTRVGYQDSDDYLVTEVTADGIRKSYAYVKRLGITKARELGLVDALTVRCRCGNLIKAETSSTPDVYFCPYCGREHATAYKPDEESFDALAYKLERNGFDAGFHAEDPELTDWEWDDIAVDDIKSERQANHLYCKSPEELVLKGLVNEGQIYIRDLVKSYYEVQHMTEFGRKTFLADKGNRFVYDRAKQVVEALNK